MCVCISICIYIYINICIYTHIHTYKHRSMYKCSIYIHTIICRGHIRNYLVARSKDSHQRRSHSRAKAQIDSWKSDLIRPKLTSEVNKVCKVLARGKCGARVCMSNRNESRQTCTGVTTNA